MTVQRHDPFGAVVSWVERGTAGGPLEGLRLGVKDVIAVAGVPRLCGAPDLVDRSPQPADAPCVADLAAAGADIVATTTTPPFAYGVTTPGTTNPVAPDRTPGGSSGGSAAAVAAGLVDAALGTDTAGSVRIPAACCGVAGLKTTQGAIDRTGVHPLAPTLDTVGVISRDVGTLRLVAGALPGAAAAAQTGGRLRVGLVDEVADLPLDRCVTGAVQMACDALRGEGAMVSDVSVPLFHVAHAARGRVLASEALRTLAFVLEARRHVPEDLRRDLERARMLSTDSVLEARRTGAHLRDRLVHVFRSLDALVLPVFACRVPAAGAREVTINGHRERTTSALTRLTGPWNLAGVPAGVVRVGTDDDGVPTAVQVVGPWHGESTVLRAMQIIERATG